MTANSALREAVAQAETALEERARIEALAASITGEQSAASARAEQARQLLDGAAAEDRLNPGPAAKQRLKASEAELVAADTGLAQLEALQRALPSRLAAADQQLVTAAAALDAAHGPAKSAALEVFAGELRDATNALAVTLARGYALASAGVQLGQQLDQATIPNPVFGAPPFLGRGVVSTSADPMPLAAAWQGDPTAVATRAALAPAQSAKLRLDRHLGRIADEASRARLAENVRNRASAFERTGNSHLPPMAAPAPTPRQAFVPGVYRQPGTPVASEADWSSAGRAVRQR